MVKNDTNRDSKIGQRFDKQYFQVVDLKGKKLPDKLRLLTCIKSFRKISENHNVDNSMITYVIKGKKKSKRVEQILLDEYKLTLSEIQGLIVEHITRMESGNPITDEEIAEWYLWYRARNMGISVDELRERETFKGFGADYYHRKRKREAYYKKAHLDKTR